MSSTFPAGSIARTWNLCLPSSRRLYFSGESQSWNWSFLTCLSNAHSNVDPASSDSNPYFAFGLSVLFFGDLVISVSGGSVSVGVAGGGAGGTSVSKGVESSEVLLPPTSDLRVARGGAEVTPACYPRYPSPGPERSHSTWPRPSSRERSSTSSQRWSIDLRRATASGGFDATPAAS